MSGLVIRKAEAGDVKVLAELDKLCFDDPWSEESFQDELTRNERALYIVAENEDGICGYAGLWAILDEGHITNVAVAPHMRRKGIGKAVVSVLLDVGEQNDLNAFTLEVRESNLAAQKLYGQMGFKSAGMRKGYYSNNGENAIIMWRTRE